MYILGEDAVFTEGTPITKQPGKSRFFILDFL